MYIACEENEPDRSSRYESAWLVISRSSRVFCVSGAFSYFGGSKGVLEFDLVDL